LLKEALDRRDVPKLREARCSFFGFSRWEIQQLGESIVFFWGEVFKHIQNISWEFDYLKNYASGI
jgi:hypothetical protein